MSLESRVKTLERRMDAFEKQSITNNKRKAAVIDESESDDFIAPAEAASSAAAATAPVDDGTNECLLQNVLTHFKPLSDLEWTRRMSVTQTDPAKLDAYFTGLVQSLVISGYLDSFTAWQRRFVLPTTTVFKQRPVDTYHMKNLLVFMNLLAKVRRGKQASDAMLEMLKKRSTYEKVMDLAHRVARGETLTYEPTFASLQLEASAPKRASNPTGGSKKKLFAQKKDMLDSDDSDASSDENDDASEDEAHIHAPAPAHAAAPVVPASSSSSSSSTAPVEAPAVAPTTPEAPAEAPVSPADADVDASATPEAADASDDADCSFVNADDADLATQPQPATQVPVASIEKVDLFAMPSSACTAPPVVPSTTFVPTAAASASSSNTLRSRFMATKKVLQHPMMDSLAPLDWEPLDVNRHGMVLTSTDAWDSYLNWRKAFDADPRIENRYTEYTRPNGDRTSVIGYYVRFFTARPCMLVPSPEDVASMKTSDVNTIYVHWLATLTKSESRDSIREAL